MKRLVFILAIVSLLLLCSCSHPKNDISRRESILTPNNLRDVEFYSRSMQRWVRYSVLLPSDYASSGRTYPVVYLLHGKNGFRTEWTTRTHLLENKATRQMIIVMPDAEDAYYTNEVHDDKLRWEDCLTHDLMEEVESHYAAAKSRESRAVIGVSLGGYGAIKFGLKHPELYASVYSVSGAVDITRRKFRLRRALQWWTWRKVFGPAGSDMRSQNDVFDLLAKADRSKPLPMFYLACGMSDPLLETNRSFDRALSKAGIVHSYTEQPGAHQWDYWDMQVNQSLVNFAATHVLL